MSDGPASRRTDERKVATILFADLVGSTDLGERLDPERLQALLRAYFGAMAGIIERWGGTVEKYIGDAIMAVFGVPSTHEDDPRRAVGAALEMLSTVEQLNAGFRDRYGVTLELRIGVNTGNVMAPVAGPAGEMIVVGDAVNVTARLEQAAEPGTVLIGERTHAATVGQLRFEEPRALELRGKSKPVTAWRVLGPRTDQDDDASHVESPMVGRQRELRGLAEALEDAIERRSLRLGLVFGSAGIGKSRLVRAFTEDVTKGGADVHVLRGRCISAGNGITYWALGEIVRREFGIALDDSPETAAERLATGVRAAVSASGMSEADIPVVSHALATSAGIHLDGNPLDALRPSAVATELARAWPRFLSALAETRPLLVLIEDLHWADSQLLAILDAIRTRSVGPIVVIATARPEFAEDHPEFNVAVDGTSLTLRPLAAGESADLLVNQPGAAALPESLRRGILERAEGNPFFLEQLVGGLVDAGALVREGDAWAFRGEGARDVLPDTVQAVLAARIDRLPAEHKAVLQEAAVVGRAFWPSAVALTLERAIVDEALAGLEAKGLLVERPTSSITGEPEFAFRHALILDVAYQSVPLARRARSHARAAAWLQDIAGQDDQALVELVAHHYRGALLAEGSDLAWADEPEARAVARERAFAAMLAAGTFARRRNANARAVELHEAALAAAVDDAERAAALEELGDDHGFGVHGDQSADAWGRALALRRTERDDEAIARICVKAARISVMFYGGFPQRPSGEVVDRYIDEGLAHAQDPVTRSMLLALRGRAGEAWSAEGRPDPRGPADRLAAAEEALRLAVEAEDPDARVLALRTLDGLEILTGNDARGVDLARELVASLDEVAALRDRVMNGHQAGALLMDIAGEFEPVLDLYRQLDPMARDLSIHEQMHATYFTMAALYRLARWDEIVPLAHDHLAMYDQETVDMNCPYTRSGPVVAAIVFERLGQLDAAHRAEQRIAPNDERPGLVESWMAERALRRGDAAEARDIARRMGAPNRPSSFDEPPYELPVLVDALAALREWDALADVLPVLRDRSSRISWLPPAIDRAEGTSLAALGQDGPARASLQAALDAYERLGMPVEVAETRALLSSVAVGAPRSRAAATSSASSRRAGPPDD